MFSRLQRPPFILAVLGATLATMTRARAQSAPTSQPASRPAAAPTSTSAPSTGLDPGFVARVIKTADGQERRYAVFLPDKYDPARRWPVVVFLNGSGENGTDGVQQTRIGLGPFLVKHRGKVPFIAVFPQGRGWIREAEAQAVLQTLAAVQREYSTDPDRVYLTGLSMGGFGTWELAMQRPDLFAAIVPVCGGGPVEFAGNLRNMPIWAFHGARDDRVPADLTRKLIAALEKLGAKPKYTEFPNVGHLCWDQAYATQGLFPWLLKQRRGKAPMVIAAQVDMTWSPVPTQVWWFRIDAVEPGAKIVQVQAGLAAQDELRVATRGIQAFTLAFGDVGTDAGKPLKVTWQGKPVYTGGWKSEIAIRPPADEKKGD